MRRSLLKLILVVFLAAAALFAGPPSAQAQPVLPCSGVNAATFSGNCAGSATKYLFTLLSFKLRPSVGADVTLVSNASQQAFDAAAVSAGGQVGVWQTGLSIPGGTYPNLIVELNRTFTASGPTVTLPGLPTRTCPAATDAVTTIAIPSNQADVTFEDLGSDNMRVIATVSGLTLAGAVTIDFNITIDAGTGVVYTFPAAPGNCTGSAAGALLLNMSFTCVSGACPSGPAPAGPAAAPAP